MTREEADNAISVYDALLERALVVVESAPYFQYVGQTEHARIDIGGEEATLTWAEIDIYYDSATLTRQAFAFPASLLFVTAAKLTTWKAEQRTLYEREQEQRKAQKHLDSETMERKELAALKAKYEHT